MYFRTHRPLRINKSWTSFSASHIHWPCFDSSSLYLLFSGFLSVCWLCYLLVGFLSRSLFQYKRKAEAEHVLFLGTPPAVCSAFFTEALLLTRWVEVFMWCSWACCFDSRQTGLLKCVAFAGDATEMQTWVTGPSLNATYFGVLSLNIPDRSDRQRFRKQGGSRGGTNGAKCLGLMLASNKARLWAVTLLH